MANVVKKDIINSQIEANIELSNSFISKGIKLATPFLGGVLALVLIYTV